LERVKFLVKAPEAFVLTLLSGRGFWLKNIKRTGGEISFFAKQNEALKIEECLNKANVKFIRQGDFGVKTGAESLLKRFGFLIGFALGLALIALYSLTVFGADIHGLEIVEAKSVHAVLKNEGINFPHLRLKKDADKLSLKIVELSGISHASVSVNGSRLVINVTEELPYEAPKDTQTPISVIAQFSGVISKIITVQGTPLVKVGDTVKKGDILIAPYIKSPDGTEVPLRAIGEVYALVWHQKHLYYPDTVIRQVRTGKTEVKTATNILKLNYLPKTSFVNYDYEQHTRQVLAIIPFSIIKTTFYETTAKETQFDFNKEKDLIVAKETDLLISSVPKHLRQGAEGKTWHIAKRVDNATRLSIYYELNQRICTAVQVSAPHS